VGDHFGATDYCKGVTEHIHPLLGGPAGLVSYRYYGLAQGTNGLWVGGWDRSIHYDFGVKAGNFWSYEAIQGDPGSWLDVWADSQRDPGYVGPGEEKVDMVTSVAAMPDGSAWFGSLGWGAARLNSGGAVVQHLTTASGLLDNHVTAAAPDPAGHGVWFGYNYGGLSRFDGGFQHFGWETFGYDQVEHRLTDLYGDRAGHRVLFSFANGLVGIRAEN
jgi:hypothetical protein